MGKATTRGRDGTGNSTYDPKVEVAVERVMDDLVEQAGGRRSFKAGADRLASEPKNADYILDTTAIELKFIESDGLSSPEVVEKLAALFRPKFPDWPVVPIMPEMLEHNEKRTFRDIVGLGVMRDFKKASSQLKQTRADNPDLTHSVVMIVNNHGRAFDYEFLRDICIKNLNHNTKSIDGVLVASVDLVSDGFETYALMPFSYYARSTEYNFSDPSGDEGHSRGNRPSFPGYASLLRQWDRYSVRLMQQALIGIVDNPEDRGLPSKRGFTDAIFEHDGVTYVMPAPGMGPSSMFPRGRPRANSSGITTCPPVCTLLIAPQEDQKNDLSQYLPANQPQDPSSIDQIIRRNQETAERPLIAVRDLSGWDEWLSSRNKIRSQEALFAYANELVSSRIAQVTSRAIRTIPDMNLPRGAIFLKCTPIGIDKANDVAELHIVGKQQGDIHVVYPLEVPVRMFREIAMFKAAAWALTYGENTFYIDVDNRFSWI